MANYKPASPDHGHAFWRRMRLIVFTVTIPEAERESFGQLCDRLAAEGSGILQCALDGLAKWHADRLGTPAEIAEAVEGYRRDTDNVTRFLAECCDRDPATRIRPGELYGVYRRWCATWGEQAGHARDSKRVWWISESSGVRSTAIRIGSASAYAMATAMSTTARTLGCNPLTPGYFRAGGG